MLVLRVNQLVLPVGQIPRGTGFPEAIPKIEQNRVSWFDKLQHEPISVDKIAEEIRTCISALPDSSVPSVRPVRREFSRRLARAGPQKVINLALALLDEPGLRWVAYELVHHHRAALASLDAEALEQLGRGIDSWGAVDPFAVYLAGPAWRQRQIPDSLIHCWARSESRWWRRAALVSTVALNTKAR